MFNSELTTRQSRGEALHRLSIAHAHQAAIESERETALKHLQEGELVLRLLVTRFDQAKARLEEVNVDVQRLKENLGIQGVDTSLVDSSSRTSPEPPHPLSTSTTVQHNNDPEMEVGAQSSSSSDGGRGSS